MTLYMFLQVQTFTHIILDGEHAGLYDRSPTAGSGEPVIPEMQQRISTMGKSTLTVRKYCVFIACSPTSTCSTMFVHRIP